MSTRIDLYLRDRDKISDVEFWETSDERGSIQFRIGDVNVCVYGMEGAEHEFDLASQLADACRRWKKHAKRRAIAEGDEAY